MSTGSNGSLPTNYCLMVQTVLFIKQEIIRLHGNETTVILCTNIMSDASFPGHRFVRRMISVSKGCRDNLKITFLLSDVTLPQHSGIRCLIDWCVHVCMYVCMYVCIVFVRMYVCICNETNFSYKI